MRKLRISKKNKFQIDSIIKKALSMKKEEFCGKKINSIRLRFKNGFSIIAKINKKASVTFSLPSEFKRPRESQPMTLGDIRHDLVNFIEYEKKGNIIYHAIEVDGDTSYFAHKGTLNFYFPKINEWKDYNPPSDERLSELKNEIDNLYERLKTEDDGEYRKNIQEAISDMQKQIWKTERYKREINADSPKIIKGYLEEYESTKPFVFNYRMETSGMTGGPVMRIDVVENGTTDLVSYPDMNISNGNFRQLADMLKTIGVDGIEDYTAEIRIDQLEEVIDSVENDPDYLENFTREGYDSHQENEEAKGPRIIDFGIDKNQLLWYLERLKELIDFARENNTGDEFIVAG